MVILRPEQPRSPLVATLGISEAQITARFPERSERFRQAMLALGYHWNSPRGPWSRELDARWNGTVEDRLIELAHALLSAGFIIELPDAALAPRVIAGEYQPEQRRWVKGGVGGPREGWLTLEWGRDQDFYGRAIRLPGAQYEAGRVIAPADAWREVLDLAEAGGFSLSAKAQEIIAAARARYEAMVLAVPAPKRKAAPAAPVAPAGGIHPDLMDDEAV